VVSAQAGSLDLAPGVDRMILASERRHPQDQHVVGTVLRLRGRRPTREHLAAWVAARAPLVPALAEHLAGPARHERWTAVQDFDPAQHIHVVDDLAAMSPAHYAVNLPVPADRPRWGLWLLPADADGYALVYRVHHAAQDGVAVVHTLERLFGADTPGAPAPTGTAVPPGDTGSPGESRADLVAAVSDVPVAALRDIARAALCTVHDVYLAALAGALRAWPGTNEQSVAVRVPFSVRLPSERQDRGTRAGHTRVLLAVDEPSPRRRLALVAEQTAAWKASSARERTRRLQERMSDRMLLREFPAFPVTDDCLALTSSTRFHTPMAFDGDPVTGAFTLATLSEGHLFSTVLSTQGTRTTVSFTARAQDRQVLDLAGLWESAVGELAAASR
jgi:hypothetical protein